MKKLFAALFCALMTFGTAITVFGADEDPFPNTPGERWVFFKKYFQPMPKQLVITLVVIAVLGVICVLQYRYYMKKDDESADSTETISAGVSSDNAEKKNTDASSDNTEEKNTDASSDNTEEKNTDTSSDSADDSSNTAVATEDTNSNGGENNE